MENLIESLDKKEKNTETANSDYRKDEVRDKIQLVLNELIDSIDKDEFSHQLLAKTLNMDYGSSAEIIKRQIEVDPNNRNSFIYLSFLEVFNNLEKSISYDKMNQFTQKMFENCFDKVDDSFLKCLILLVQGNYLEVDKFMTDPNLPVIYKTLYALYYVKTNATGYIEKMLEIRNPKFILEGLLFSVKKANKLIADYINEGNNLLVGYLLASIYCTNSPFHSRIESSLSDFLNQFRLYEMRINLKKIVNQFLCDLNEKEENKITVDLVCSFCVKPLHYDKTNGKNCDTAIRSAVNSSCKMLPPSCCICLLPIDFKTDESTKASYVWCTFCKHGGHLEEMKEWFENFLMCPESKCECVCANGNLVN